VLLGDAVSQMCVHFCVQGLCSVQMISLTRCLWLASQTGPRTCKCRKGR